MIWRKWVQDCDPELPNPSAILGLYYKRHQREDFVKIAEARGLLLNCGFSLPSEVGWELYSICYILVLPLAEGQEGKHWEEFEMCLFGDAETGVWFLPEKEWSQTPAQEMKKGFRKDWETTLSLEPREGFYIQMAWISLWGCMTCNLECFLEREWERENGRGEREKEKYWEKLYGDGQGGLACCDSWGRKESDTTERLNWTDSRKCPVCKGYMYLLVKGSQ